MSDQNRGLAGRFLGTEQFNVVSATNGKQYSGTVLDCKSDVNARDGSLSATVLTLADKASNSVIVLQSDEPVFDLYVGNHVRVSFDQNEITPNLIHSGKPIHDDDGNTNLRGRIAPELREEVEKDEAAVKRHLTDIHTERGQVYFASNIPLFREEAIALIQQTGDAATLKQFEQQTDKSADTSILLTDGLRVNIYTSQKEPPSLTIAFTNLNENALANLAEKAGIRSPEQMRANPGLAAPPVREVETIGVALTKDQVSSLINSEYPTDSARREANAALQNGEGVSVMDGMAMLDYSQDQGTFFAELDRDDKPALDSRLTELRADRERSADQSSKAAPSREREEPSR